MAKDRTEQYLSSIAIELVRIRRILQGIMDLSCAETVKEEKCEHFLQAEDLFRGRKTLKPYMTRTTVKRRFHRWICICVSRMRICGIMICW